MKIGVAGVWKDIEQVYVGVGGVWKTGETLAVGVGGVWKVGDLIQVQLAASYDESRVTIPSGSAFAGFRLHTDGTIDGTESAASLNWGVDEGTWLMAGSNSAYQVSCTKTGDAHDGTSSASDGSWMLLSTTRHWEYSQSGLGSKAGTLTIQVRRVSDSVVIASTSVTLHAEVTT